MKRIFLISLLTMFSTSFADNGNSFTITTEMIQSSEKCPVSGNGQLKCPAYHQTTNYTCGPAAVMTLMRYYGLMGAASANKNSEMRIANEMGAVPGEGGGTTRANVEEWLSNHGFKVTSGSNVTTDMLIDNIKKHIPTLVSFNNHWILAKGYNKGSSSTYKNQDEIIFADSCCGTSVLTREEIDTTWQSQHMSRNHCSVNGDYIVAVPNR